MHYLSDFEPSWKKYYQEYYIDGKILAKLDILMVLSFFVLGFIGIIQRMQWFHKQIKSSWTWTWWFIKGMWMVHSVISEIYMCWVSAKSHYLLTVSTFVMVCFTKKTRNLFGQCTDPSADNNELIPGFFSFLRTGTIMVFWICFMSS